MTRILQISDPHVVVPPKKLSNRVNSAEKLRFVVDDILENRTKYDPIDAIVITGDISENGDFDSYKLFREEIKRIDLPCFVIPGNHDQREALRRCFQYLPTMPHRGRINWVHEFEDVCLVGLDTLIPGEGKGTFDLETSRFLSNVLEKSTDKPLLVAMHHPPITSDIRFMDGIGLQGVALLKDTLAKAQTEVRIICGHLHSLVVGSVGEAVTVVSPSVSSTIPVDFRSDATVGYSTVPGGYMLHDWSDGFRSNLISLASGTGPHPF